MGGITPIHVWESSLSHYDTLLHNNFFPRTWQVALVVEPHTSLEGSLSVDANGTLDPTRYYGFYEINGNLGREYGELEKPSGSPKKKVKEYNS